MFGTRLKTWMENYIGRPKKKVQAEANKGKPKTNRAGGLILDSSESLAQSDTGISSGSQQVLSSSTTDYRESYSTATMDSDRSALIHCHTAISLPSPESAYSTGYSTDGTSPGATAPPEYYINIRTGKHYFPSPAPTPTSPNPHTAFPNLHSAHPCLTVSFPPHRLSRTHPPPPDSAAPLTSRPKYRLHSPSALTHHAPPHPQPLSTPLPPHLKPPPSSHPPPKKTSPRAQCASLKLFLRSPRDAPKPKTDLTKNKLLSPSKSKKWFRQPFHKFAHRRMDPCEDNAPAKDVSKQSHRTNPISLLPAQDAGASPRQRNRIKTNPWLPTAPTSSNNLHPAFPLPSRPRNRSCNNTPLQHRKSNHLQPLPPSSQHPPEAPDRPPSPSHTPNLFDSIDRSDEDLTLNEMMGTYNESYVYEKETDILSDSDPTDCDDYDTDSDADKVGDERDSHDDELDFIDNASPTDSDDGLPPNTGRCTYHHLGPPNKYPFLCNPDRRHSRKDLDHRRSLRKPHDLKGRKERRRQGGRRCSRCEDEDSKNQSEGSTKKAQIDENVGGLNLRRVLLERVMAKSVPRGLEGSAVAGRRGRSDAGRGGDGSPRVAVVLLDEEADERYKELMEEAENMLESLRNSPMVKSRKKMHRLDEGDGRREKSMEIRKEPDVMCCRELQANDPRTPPRKSAKSLVLTLPVETARKGGNKSSFKARSSAHSPLDPLGPALRNFAVFHPPVGCGNELRTSSDDSDPSDPGDAFGAKGLGRGGGAHESSSLVPIAFQSVVLGKPLTSYCPQSEPVKRKIYSCSKTYDRLVKHLEQNPVVFEEIQPGGLAQPHRPTMQQPYPSLPTKPPTPPTHVHNTHPHHTSPAPFT